MKCRACSQGDCFGHVAEFLDSKFGVRKCDCPDTDRKHGKLRDFRKHIRKVIPKK